eukprot:jgi/Tetstr1/453192/TSEL_040209.t1
MARSASPSWAWLLVSLVVMSPCFLVSVLAVDKFELAWNELLESRKALHDVFKIHDLLAPAEEPLRDLVEDGTGLPASSPASSAELLKTITAALALCTNVALRINKRGKKLHVEHDYGAEVTKEFDAVDPLGEKGLADNTELKKAIEKVKAKKP